MWEGKSYSELLTDKNWRDKREIILMRDHYTCSGCNNNFLSDFQIGLALYSNVHPYPSYSKRSITLRDQVLHVFETPFLKKVFSTGDSHIVYYENDDTLRECTVHGIESISSDTNIMNLTDYDALRAYSINLAKEKLQNSEEYVLRKRKANLIKWEYVKGLHVHHTYYQYGCLPWQYPDSSLETYCWKCHLAIHSNKQVLLLNTEGRKVGYLSPCLKCAGAGWIPEYNHVAEGICFMCQGAKYIEMFER